MEQFSSEFPFETSTAMDMQRLRPEPTANPFCYHRHVRQRRKVQKK